MEIGCSPDWRDMFLMRCWFDYNEVDIPDNIEGLDVLIVDDIIDTGYTMEFVIDHRLSAKF